MHVYLINILAIYTMHAHNLSIHHLSMLYITQWRIRGARLFAAIHFVDTRLFIRNIEIITSCLSNAHGNHIAEQKREPAQNRLVIVAV